MVGVAVSVIVSVSIFRFIFDRSTGPMNALLSTRTIALLACDAAFRDGEIGYANAISFALLAVILLVTLALNRFTGEND